MNFWQKLPKPIIALAPMQDVSDCAFREIFAKYGKPDVCFTEFVNVDGLLHPTGFERLKLDLQYSENQRPIVAQIWGTDPEKFFKAAELVKNLGFDGVDINMGCPQDKEIGIGACAALIRNPKLAGEIIEATIQGAGHLPVSVKTRLGYTKASEMAEWVKFLLGFKLAALTLHARTKQEKSAVPAQWEKVAEAVRIRNQVASSKNQVSSILIIGNGDIKTHEEALERIKETGCDGVMIARGSFGNPWLFRKDGYIPSVKERLQVMVEHAELYEKMYATLKSFVAMRKNFKAYVSGFEGAGELRAKLMETENVEQVREIVKMFSLG